MFIPRTETRDETETLLFFIRIITGQEKCGDG